MDAAIFQTLQRVQNEENSEAREALMDETAEELGVHFRHNLDDLEELAADLLNIAWTDTSNQELVRQLIEVKTVGLGDVDRIDEELYGMRAYWQGKGGQIRSFVLRYDSRYMPREEMVAAIDLHQDEIELDFWGQFGKLTAHAEEKLRNLPVEKLVELMEAGVVNAPYLGTFAAAALTDTQVDSVVDPVAEESDGDISIVGTATALRKLAKVGLEFGDNMKEQIFRTGIIGVYKGYRLVQVQNFKDFHGRFVLPSDELWIVGRNAGRLTYYGRVAKVQQLKQPSFMLRWETARDAGMLLYGKDKGRLGRIKFT